MPGLPAGRRSIHFRRDWKTAFLPISFFWSRKVPVVLCGESAGGGMIYALCFLAKEKGLPCQRASLAFRLGRISPPQAAHTKRIGSGTPP